MKRFKLFAMLMVLLCSSSLFAKEFDWSECWCNYGGGLKEGEWVVTATGALYYADLAYSANDGFWFIPPVMVEVQYAQPIWKLPFTFGGYAGLRAFGYKYTTIENGKAVTKETSSWSVFSGAEAAYHIMLPPESLDVYVVSRFGVCVPIIKPYAGWTYLDYVNVGSSIGANWYFGKNVGLNLELGYPFSKFGVSVQF